jgi:outer membrane lipoprotein
MPRTSAHVSLLLAGLLLTACANAPRFNLSGVDNTLTPAGAVLDMAQAGDRVVHWGGSIIETTNLKDSTRIEVLAYPMDRNGLPDLSDPAQGRFTLLQAGYLESADYAPGRLVSVVGKLTQTQTSRIGGAQAVFPVVQAEQLYLWPPDAQHPRTQFHFGLGVGISR